MQLPSLSERRKSSVSETRLVKGALINFFTLRRRGGGVVLRIYYAYGKIAALVDKLMTSFALSLFYVYAVTNSFQVKKVHTHA